MRGDTNRRWRGIVGNALGAAFRRTGTQGSRRERLFFEPLEVRQLLSATPTTLAVTSSAGSITYGQSITLAATVSSTTTPNEGTVTFMDGATVLGTGAATSGTVTLPNVLLPAGNQIITAAYADPLGTYAASSTTVGPNSIITTVAGGGTNGLGDGGQATDAALSNPSDVVVDSSGDIFIADLNNARIREVNHLTGVITTVAGGGLNPMSDNGPATAAQLADPIAIAIDSAGNLFIAGYTDQVVSKVNLSTGVMTVVAGNGTAGFSGDNGPATAAELDLPDGLAFDSSGNLFIAERANDRVREVNAATGVINTVAGGGQAGSGLGDNGPATAATLWNPAGITVDSSENLFIADEADERIREVNRATGVITTVAGNGDNQDSGDDGPATAASFRAPGSVAVDASGDLFIADVRVREVNQSTGVITTVAGRDTAGSGNYGDNGPATDAFFYSPAAVFLDSAGDLFIAANRVDRILEVASGTVEVTVNPLTALPTTVTVATSSTTISLGESVTLTATVSSTTPPDEGTVTFLNNGVVLAAQPVTGGLAQYNATLATGFHSITASYSDASGTFASSSNVGGPNWLVTTVAGQAAVGGGSFSGDGQQATAATLFRPEGTALDSAGDLFIADAANNRVREVTQAGVITTVAGNGISDFSGDGGQATAASLSAPVAVAVDSAGDLFISDADFLAPGNDRIREVTPSGIITTVAGNGIVGYSGDGGPATAASLDDPLGLAVDSTGDLFIADAYNNVVRKVTPSGVITTVAGNGSFGFSGDGGQATAATLNTPESLALDSAGNLFISDFDNQRVREVSPSGIISTVAGNGGLDVNGENVPATATPLESPRGLAVDSSGDLFIADKGYGRILKVNPSGIISTVVLNQAPYYYEGGEAVDTDQAPTSISLDSSGDIYIASALDNQIVKLTDGAFITVSPVSVSAVSSQATFVPNVDGSTPVTVFSGLSVTSPVPQSLIASAAITINNDATDPEFSYSEEVLAVNTAGTGITATFISGSDVLYLSGISTAADYQQVLSTLTYNDKQFPVPSTAPRSITVTLTTTDNLPISINGTVLITASVVSCSIFYHDSYFDGFNATTTAEAKVADDAAAIAADKSALLPGQTATFANVSSYTQGINGVIVDIAGSNYAAGPMSAATIASDFTFQTGNSTTSGSFSATTAPASITVFKGAGRYGTDRLEMIWVAGTAVTKGWLEVTIVPDTAGDNLPAGSPDIFYFGSDPGDTYTSANPIKVVAFVGSAADELNAKGHFVAKGTAAITDLYDFNRDGQVNNLDQLVARVNEANKLAVIAAPAAPTVLGSVTALSPPQAGGAKGAQVAALETEVAYLYAGTLDSDLLNVLANGRHKK